MDIFEDLYFPRRYMLVILAFVANLCEATYRVAVGVAVEVIRRDNDKDKYGWSPGLQGLVLCAPSYGFILSQLPFGMLTMMYSPKHLVVMSSLVTLLCNALAPACAGHSAVALIANFCITGIAMGALGPSLKAVLVRWIPQHEKAVLLGITASGSSFGVALGFGGYSTIAYFFDWKALFYIQAVIMLIFTVWFQFGMEVTPDRHPTISDTELEYIQLSIGRTKNLHLAPEWKSVTSIPWCRIISNRAVIAMTVLLFAYSYAHFTVIMSMQQYLDNILGLTIIESGYLLAVPFVLMTVTMIMAGYASDRAIIRGIDITLTRKVAALSALSFHSFGFLALGFLSSVFSTEICLIAIISLGGIARTAAGSNVFDIAGPYTGLVQGISGSIGLFSGIIAPQLGSVLGSFSRDQSEMGSWRVVFLINSVIGLIAAIVFVIHGSGVLQDFAVIPDLADDLRAEQEKPFLDEPEPRREFDETEEDEALKNSGEQYE